MMAQAPPSSSGLGRRPFKAVTRVRIRWGYGKTVSVMTQSKVLWSSWSARRPVKAEVAGSSPVRTADDVFGHHQKPDSHQRVRLFHSWVPLWCDRPPDQGHRTRAAAIGRDR